MISFRGLLGCACLLVALPAFAQSFSADPDLSECDNCAFFPDEFLRVDPADLLDLASLLPERRLDFLIGEWELLFPFEDPDQGIHYTADMPIGFEIFDWFVPNKILQAYQEWPFTSGGGMPFRAKSDFRYMEDDGRWQMTWLTSGSTAIYTGGLEPGGAIALYEYHWSGDADNQQLTRGMLYVFRNITRDSFLAEMYMSTDGGETYDQIDWRVRYRRRR